jgi:hypothetical protein
MKYSLLLLAPVAIAAVIAAGCNQSTEVMDPSASDRSLPESPSPAEVTTVSFANAKCPIMGGNPTGELTTDYQGMTIGFCCEGCPEKWAELSDEQQAEKFAKVRVSDTGDSAAEQAHDAGVQSEHNSGEHEHSDQE